MHKYGLNWFRVRRGYYRARVSDGSWLHIWNANSRRWYVFLNGNGRIFERDHQVGRAHLTLNEAQFEASRELDRRGLLARS